jgi:hypothetical protein
MTLLVTTLHKMTILITLNLVDIIITTLLITDVT